MIVEKDWEMRLSRWKPGSILEFVIYPSTSGDRFLKINNLDVI